MKPHVAVITLGVRDLKQARRFYSEGLEWPTQQEDSNWVCFLLGDLESAAHRDEQPSQLRHRLDDETRERLERWRRGGS